MVACYNLLGVDPVSSTVCAPSVIPGPVPGRIGHCTFEPTLLAQLIIKAASSAMIQIEQLHNGNLERYCQFVKHLMDTHPLMRSV